MTVKFYRLFNLFSTLRHAFKSYSLTVLFTKGLVAKNNFIADKITFGNRNEGLKPYLKIRKKKKKKSDKSESDRVYQKVVCKREISTGLKLFLISLSNPLLCSSRVKGVHSCYVMFWIVYFPVSNQCSNTLYVTKVLLHHHRPSDCLMCTACSFSCFIRWHVIKYLIGVAKEHYLPVKIYVIVRFN